VLTVMGGGEGGGVDHVASVNLKLDRLNLGSVDKVDSQPA